MPLVVGQMLKAVLGVEAIELPRRKVLRVIPNPDVEAVRVEDDWAVPIPLFKAIGIEFGLMPTKLGIGRGLLRLDHGQRVPVVIPQHVIGVTDARSRRLSVDLDFLAHLGRVLNTFCDIPAHARQHAIDEARSGFCLAELKFIGSCLCRAC